MTRMSSPPTSSSRAVHPLEVSLVPLSLLRHCTVLYYFGYVFSMRLEAWLFHFQLAQTIEYHKFSNGKLYAKQVRSRCTYKLRQMLLSASLRA